MLIAEDIYNEETQEERAMRLAIDVRDFAMGGIQYVEYTFSDKSKLTFGANGYIGCECPL